MKTNVKTFLAMALVTMTFASGAKASTFQENFVQRQLISIQNQNQLIAKGIETKTLTKIECDFYVAGLRNMTADFAKTAAGIGASDADVRAALSGLNLVSIEQCH